MQTFKNVVKKNVRQSLDRPRGFQEVEAPKVRKSAYGGDKVTYQP
jgi:hypothetical protein